MEHKTLSLSDAQVKFAAQEDEWTFRGYGSKFNSIDSYGDTILPGAYDDIIMGLRRKSARPPKMLLNHRMYSLPIGKWATLDKDDYGLALDGELTKGMQAAAETRAALQHDTVDGLSIGYVLEKGDYDIVMEGGEFKGRIIKRVARLPEVSVVTFAADQGAKIDATSVKSFLDKVGTLADCEDLLREAGGFSKSEATQIVSVICRLQKSRGEPGASQQPVPLPPDVKGLVASIVFRTVQL